MSETSVTPDLADPGSAGMPDCQPRVGALRAPAGLRTRRTGGHVRPARRVPRAGWRQVLRQSAGQQVKQEMAGPEVCRGGPDAPAGDELQSGGRCGPAVDVQSHPQGRAQRSPGQADLDPACTGLGIVLHRPGQLACAGSEFAAVPGTLPASSAATHVSNGTSTIRRNDSDADTGPMLALMLARLAG